MGTRDLRNSGFGFGSDGNNENYNKMKERIMERVQSLFSPELMNRIDESIVFHSLTESNVYQIIDLQVSDLIQNLSKLGLNLQLNKSAKKCLVHRGFDPRYGVRLLRREIQRSLEDPISEMLLKNVFTHGTTISVKALKNELIFNYKPGEKPKSKSPKSPKSPKLPSK